MSKILVIGDIHTAVDRVQDLLDSTVYDQCIFLGDYFDTWGDGVVETKKTALWLKQSLQDPRHIHLIGNHDLPYMIPNKFTWCPGWDQLKYVVANEVLTESDWNKLWPCYYIEEYSLLFSHAGFSHGIFWGLTPDEAVHKAFKGYLTVREGNESEVFGQGQDVGYPAPFSGISWQRWNAANPLPGCTQIVGHTPVNRPMFKYCNQDGIVTENHKLDLYNCRAELGILMNIDTGLRYYIMIEDGEINTYVWN